MVKSQTKIDFSKKDKAEQLEMGQGPSNGMGDAYCAKCGSKGCLETNGKCAGCTAEKVVE